MKSQYFILCSQSHTPLFFLILLLMLAKFSFFKSFLNFYVLHFNNLRFITCSCVSKGIATSMLDSVIALQLMIFATTKV